MIKLGLVNELHLDVVRSSTDGNPEIRPLPGGGLSHPLHMEAGPSESSVDRNFEGRLVVSLSVAQSFESRDVIPRLRDCRVQP